MKKVLKSPYENAELEIIKLEAQDGGDVDDGGWTSVSW